MYFLGGKGDRCVRLTNVPPSCAVVMKSGNLNFLEPSDPLQACNGTALPFYLPFLEPSGPLQACNGTALPFYFPFLEHSGPLQACNGTALPFYFPFLEPSGPLQACNGTALPSYFPFLEPSGPLQACNGTALPFYVPFLEPSGPLQACNGTALPFILFWRIHAETMRHILDLQLALQCWLQWFLLPILLCQNWSKCSSVCLPQSAEQCSYLGLRQYLRPVIREAIDLLSCGWCNSVLYRCEFAAVWTNTADGLCVWKSSVQSWTGHEIHLQSNIGTRSRNNFCSEKAINITYTALNNWFLYRRFNPLQPSGYYMYHQFNIQQFYVLPTQCIDVSCVDLRTNSDYFRIQN